MAGNLADNPYAFSGQRLDPESNLYHFHFRKYDAELGVWTTADPIGVLGGVNLYQYVSNNPINTTDFLGLWEDGDGWGSGHFEDEEKENDGSPGSWDDIEVVASGPYCELDTFGDYFHVVRDKNGNAIGLVQDPQQKDAYTNYIISTVNPGKLKNVNVIAQGKNIRKLLDLVKKWGGRGKDWKKMKGCDKRGQEWHWYQKKGDGTKYGIKKKGELDPF